MRRVFLYLIGTALAAAASEPDTIGLPELTISARRPMTEIGVRRSRLDSVALKENVALSMADVLGFNSSVYVKNYGRATLSTVSFRGTSPGHTGVTWNGLPVNSPMLGMTDFSLIPSYFVDKASLLHGSASLSEASGALGGAVALSTSPEALKEGFSCAYTQGVGSFRTFDEFLRVAYRKRRWHTATRVAFSSSANDFTYINRDKKLNIYDENHNIIGQYYPKEKNRCGAFRDFHLLQEASYAWSGADRMTLSVWYTASDRQLPMITTDYGDERGVDNRQRENTVRATAAWRRLSGVWNLETRAGYIHTWSAYDYRRETGNGAWTTLTRARSLVNTYLASSTLNWWPAERWLFTASFTARLHDVRSSDRRLSTAGSDTDIGYHKRRPETCLTATARWQPVDGAGLAVMLREESFGSDLTPPIPAVFADWTALRGAVSSGNWRLTLKASGSRNFHYPTLNDLYFMPGGNPDLKSEKGLTCDCGAVWNLDIPGRASVALEAGWHDSRISDWILWLPTTKGFFSPKNVKTVHAYGVELRGEASLQFGRGWSARINGNWSWTPSENCGDPISEGDASVGKQLPYVPRVAGSATLRLQWRRWGLLAKWMGYGRRWTQSSNEAGISGVLPAYGICNITAERALWLRRVELNLKLSVCNLFDKEYQTVAGRPMAGRNFEAFLEFRI